MNNIFNVTKKVTSINEIHLKAELNEAIDIYTKINPDELIQKAFDTREVKHFYAFESM